MCCSSLNVLAVADHSLQRGKDSVPFATCCGSRSLDLQFVSLFSQLSALSSQLSALSSQLSTINIDLRRPPPDGMRSIFARLGLGADFWDPQSDRFS